MEKRYHEIQELLIRNARIHRRIVEGRIADLGIHSSQHALLMRLMRMGRIPSQMQIASMMDVSPASVARTLKNLEAGGFIERFDASEDSRCNEIGITDRGKEVCSRSIEIFAEVDRATYGNFSEEELNQLEKLLGKMQENLIHAERTEKSCACAREKEMKQI